MNLTVPQILDLAESLIRVGLRGVDLAMELKKEGYIVPSLIDFQEKTEALRDRPNLTPEE